MPTWTLLCQGASARPDHVHDTSWLFSGSPGQELETDGELVICVDGRLDVAALKRPLRGARRSLVLQP
jgi:hypothetical protein